MTDKEFGIMLAEIHADILVANKIEDFDDKMKAMGMITEKINLVERLKEMLNSCGFTIKSVYGSYDFNQYTKDSKIIVLDITK